MNVYLFLSILNCVCSFSLISPDAQKLLNQAKQLREEIKVMEKELLEERITYSLLSDSKEHHQTEYRDSLIPKVLSTKIETFPNRFVKINWELEKNGETHIQIFDSKGKTFSRGIGKWKKKRSRFGIGSNIILKAKGIGYNINCKFVSLTRYDYLFAKNSYNRCLSNLKNMNNDLDIAKRFSNNIVTLREPKPLFPIITPDSLLYKFARSLNKWYLMIHSRVLNKMFHISILYVRKNINKWKKLVNIGKSEKYIKFDNDLCVIQDRGIINIKGIIPFNDRWIRSPKASLTLKCNLEILNLIKSRTGGRAGGIKS